MASIRKRGDTYQITVSNGRDTSGRKILETTTFHPDPNRTEKQNQKALEAFARNFEERVKNGQTAGDNITFETFARNWLENYVSVECKPTTEESYRRALEKWIFPRIGHMKVSEIKPSTIQGVINGMRKDGYKYTNKKGTVRQGAYSERTLKDCQRTISAVLGAAELDGLIARNPASLVRSRKNKTPEETKLNFWTAEQATLFLDKIQAPLPVMVEEKIHHRRGKEVKVSGYIMKMVNVSWKWIAFFFLAFFSGCRKGEILGLSWNDIDFETEEININKASYYTSAKGKYLDTTKTLTSYRKIIIPGCCMAALKKWKSEQAREIMALGTAWTGDRQQKTGFVFTDETGGQLATAVPGHYFKEYTKLINATLPPEQKLPHIRIHDCRHTSASLLIAAGLDPVTVAHRLGHSDATTTLRIYSHAFKESDRKAADILEQALSFDKNSQAAI